VTIRAFILGLLGVVFVCGATYFNDIILSNTYIINGQLPTAVYGILIIFLVFLRPLFRKTFRWLALTRKEITVVLVMTIIACAIPAGHLMRHLPGVMINPHQVYESEPGWKSRDIMQYVPEGMLVDAETNRETVVSGWLSGLGTSRKHINPGQVPWYAFKKTFIFWIPIILSLWIALIALALVVHRQWSDHEHLPYPLMTFTESMLPKENGEQSEVFRNKLFWLAFCAVVLIHFYNYLNSLPYFKPYLLNPMPLTFDISAFAELSETFKKGGGVWLLMGLTRVYFVVVGIAYFLPKDVSFSLGIGPVLWALISGTLLVYGFTGAEWQQGSWRHGVNRDGMFMMGGYFAMFMMIIYTGRNYFKSVFSRALFIPHKGQADTASIWGARVFLLSLALFVTYLYIVAKIDWPLGILFACICCAVYIVMARLVAETGLFYISSICTPAGVLWAFFGAKALGPATLLVLCTLGLVLLFDSREALMPYTVNMLKLAEDAKIKVGKAAILGVVAVLLGLTVAVPVTLYWMYDQGTPSNFWPNYQGANPFKQTVEAIERLDAQGVLQEAGIYGSHTGVSRLLHITPNKPAVITFCIAAGLVLLFSFLRLRLSKWPFHPVIFLTFMTYAGRQFGFSFLIAWFIKTIVMKYGGIQIYQKLKPFMIGLIAGELFGAVLPMIISFIYYLYTGDKLAQWSIFPL
jgi:hypothetical protein